MSLFFHINALTAFYGIYKNCRNNFEYINCNVIGSLGQVV